MALILLTLPNGYGECGPFTLSIKTTKQTYYVHEPIYLTLEIRNASTEGQIETLKVDIEEPMFRVQITRPDSEVVVCSLRKRREDRELLRLLDHSKESLWERDVDATDQGIPVLTIPGEYHLRVESPQLSITSNEITFSTREVPPDLLEDSEKIVTLTVYQYSELSRVDGGASELVRPEIEAFLGSGPRTIFKDYVAQHYGCSLAATGRLEDAALGITLIRSVLERTDGNYPLRDAMLFYLARAYATIGDFDNSLRLFEQEKMEFPKSRRLAKLSNKEWRGIRIKAFHNDAELWRNGSPPFQIAASQVASASTLGHLTTTMQHLPLGGWSRIESVSCTIPFLMSSTQETHLRIKLGIELFQKVRSMAAMDTEVDNAADLGRNISSYAAINKVLLSAGGFGNYCLSDSVSRMCLAKLCHYLVRHPKEYSLIEDALSNIHILGCDSTMLKEIIADVHSDLAISLDIDSMPKKNILSEIRRQERPKGFSPSDLAMVGLMTNGKVSPLVFRLIETARVAEFQLPGLIEFLKRGGDINHLSWETTRSASFEGIMGETYPRFVFEAGGHAYLTPADLSSVVKLFGQSEMDNPFSKRGLE
jgi:hypothetical protein